MSVSGLGRVVVRIVALAAIVAALCGCRPDVVSIESVPTGKFSRDLAACNAQSTDWPGGLGDSVKRCMKAKGYRFLKQY
jgi:hypothetical protein